MRNPKLESEYMMIIQSVVDANRHGGSLNKHAILDEVICLCQPSLQDDYHEAMTYIESQVEFEMYA